ncbi:MAG: CoA transferase, partial [Acidimicrobiales bacterium]
MQGISVVELAGSVAGAWCSRLLGQLGADVFLVEPSAGSTLRTRPPLLNGESPWHHWLNGAKTSIVAEGHEAEELASGADCVIYTVPEGAGEGEVEALAERLRADRPAQVFVALSSFGLTGPWRSLASSELIDWAAGGHLYLTGDRDREPMQGGGPWPHYFAAANAVIAIQAALMQAGRTGRGQLIDIAVMESMASAHQWSVTTYTHHGYIKRRDGNRLAESYHPLGIYECSDGWLQLACASGEQWEALCILTDSVELLADDELLVPAGRYDRADEIDVAISPWFTKRTAVEAVAALQEVRVPAGVVNDVNAVLADRQMVARDAWQPVPALGDQARVPGPAIVVGARKPSEPLVAPAIGSGQEQSGRLARRAPVSLPDLDLRGVRVLEFSVAWAGPLAGRYLADLGADVIKVEHPTGRGLGVVPGGVAEGWSWGDLPPAAIRNGTWPATDPGDRWFNRMGMFNKLQR